MSERNPLGGIDDAANAFDTHIGPAGMQVGDHGDAEPLRVGQSIGTGR